MHKQIFVNLAVADLQKSIDFFKQLGLDVDPRFTDQNAACLVLGENLHAMLLTRDYFKTFVDKPLSDPKQSTEVLVCLSCESRAEVDDLVARARAAGGSVPRQPQDYGFMYGHGFEDPDGHVWELMYMDPNAEILQQ
ncbi:VOC family protein [Bordetella sp. BOR01]|uniref:VOC family protein n=1 Tax=Bordetella sp. BOR01 TaxID=2854779 RepID=UPI001C454E30|nr:VOC family protein [Bordetella sp. BOR01]MBV7482683.1 VOC family protein [Bordetella sp. BOR01]